MDQDLLQELLIVLKAIAASNPPNWQMPLKSYPNFDWSKIGASVIGKDHHGATAVRWAGHTYTRRCGENKKYGAAIWFRSFSPSICSKLHWHFSIR
jgi:hypothetical protein